MVKARYFDYFLVMLRRTSRRKPAPAISQEQQWLAINRHLFEASYRSRRNALFSYRLKFGGHYPGPSTPESREILNKFLDSVSVPADMLDYEGMT